MNLTRKQVLVTAAFMRIIPPLGLLISVSPGKGTALRKLSIKR